ncbi:MAG: TonB family protein [Sphingobacteriales bacterium]|nr:MAG: TonB family protein [Sphingobacteriales bacterium]
MKRILFLVLNLISLVALAQQSDTLYSYTNIGGKEVKKEKAVNVYKVFRRDSTSWVKTTSDHNLIMLKKETFKDSTLSVLNGSYTEYASGKVKLKGYYIKGNKTGAWVSYDTAGRATESEVYSMGKLNGPYTSYWPAGNTKEEGRYENGKRAGNWKFYYKDGSIASDETYNDSYNLVDSSYFDPNHNPTSKIKIINPPMFPGGMPAFYQFLGRSIRYPTEAVKNQISGTVYCSFVVDTAGKLQEIKVISSPHYSLSDEAMRILRYSPKWIPASVLGDPVRVRYNVAINFKL